MSLMFLLNCTTEVWESVSVEPRLKTLAMDNLSDSCQLCTPLYCARQTLRQWGLQPGGMKASENV